MDISIIIIIALALLFIYPAIRLFQDSRRDAKWKRISKLLKDPIERLQYLDDSMERLVKEHPVIDKLDDAYNLIANYVICKTEDEQEYCKKYLRKLYAPGFMRYDDERGK